LNNNRSGVGERAEQRRNRRHPGGKQQCLLGMLEPRQHLLSDANDVGIVARIDVVGIDQRIVLVAQKGGRGLHRRHDPARRQIDDAARLGRNGGWLDVVGKCHAGFVFPWLGRQNTGRACVA
jgi:hypothetical protein